MIRISKVGDDIISVSFSYNPYFVTKIKTIKGYRWHLDDSFCHCEPRINVGAKQSHFENLGNGYSFATGEIKSPLDTLNLKKEVER